MSAVESNHTKSNKRNSTITCKKFNPTNISITELDENNERSKAQSIAYVHYQYRETGKPEQFIFQTDDIKLTDYGIPDLGEFVKEDSERQYIKVPFDKTQKSCLELQSMLEKIDEYVLSNQENIFGETSKLYKYVPLVREPIELEGIELKQHIAKLEKAGKKYVKRDKPLYCKVKFDTDYNTKELETRIFDATDKNSPPEELEIQTITELTHHVRYQSTIRMIISVNKLWAQKTSKKGEKREFGLSMKCVLLQLKERAQSSSSLKEQIRSGAIDFVDDDDEEDDEPVVPSKTVQSVVSQQVVKEEEDEEEEEEDEDDEEEEEEEDAEEEEEPPTPAPKVAAKPVPKVAAKPATTKKGTK